VSPDGPAAGIVEAAIRARMESARGASVWYGPVHPLLRTRSVPGTHDVELGLSVLDACANGRGTEANPPRHRAAVFTHFSA